MFYDGSFVHQVLHYSCIPIECGQVKWSATILVGVVDGGRSLYEGLDAVDVALQAGPAEWTEALTVLGNNWRPYQTQQTTLQSLLTKHAYKLDNILINW